MSKILSPELIAIMPVYLACALVIVLWLVLRRSQIPAVKSARAYFPVVFFGALTVFAGSFGIYYTVLCLREFFAASVTAWRYFLAAEFALLFAWRFLGMTALCLAILRGRIRSEQVRLKRGMVGRVLFIAATGAACFGYIMVKSLFGMPWWFTHLGHAVIAVLMFCTFTYPWSRRHDRTHDQTPNKSPEPTAVTPSVPLSRTTVSGRRWLSFFR
jgi:hypothetical protein